MTQDQTPVAEPIAEPSPVAEVTAAVVDMSGRTPTVSVPPPIVSASPDPIVVAVPVPQVAVMPKTVFAQSQVVSQPVDAEREASVGEQIKDLFAQSIADTVGVAKSVAVPYATKYAPLLARQALMSASSDPAVVVRAEGNRRHLYAQMLMEAGAMGIPLQQRYEQRFLAVVGTLLNHAISLV